MIHLFVQQLACVGSYMTPLTPYWVVPSSVHGISPVSLSISTRPSTSISVPGPPAAQPLLPRTLATTQYINTGFTLYKQLGATISPVALSISTRPSTSISVPGPPAAQLLLPRTLAKPPPSAATVLSPTMATCPPQHPPVVWFSSYTPNKF